MEGRADEGPAPNHAASLELRVDRDAEVPVGVQIAWALRTRINEGALLPGDRLPGLRELAEATGVNVNTAKSVYQRLEQAGLIDSQQGSGTFVAATPHAALGSLAGLVADEARDHGVSARELAVALYVRTEAMPARPAAHIERRRSLRRQIAALEMAASELEAQHGLAVSAPPDLASLRRAPVAPRLLAVSDLEAARSELLRRLIAVQTAIDETAARRGAKTKRATPAADQKRAADVPQATTPKRRRRPPHAGLAGA